ncbi:MAG: 2-aminoethylphosphonate--pyruvate transaminase [Anaerolineales bacterium]
MSTLPPWKDKALFTPGPLTTSQTVKQAMLRDLGSRDFEFIDIVRNIRRRLVALSEGDEADYTAVIMQGSGTFGIESVLGSTIPADGKLLVVVNGAYGRRIAQMATVLKINHVELTIPENDIPTPEALDRILNKDDTFTDVAIVHCETTTGIINPVTEIGSVVEWHGCRYIVDAMSSFGAVPLDVAEAHIDYLISSANKCIEGVPGFSFVIARRSNLEASKGLARSLSLDLFAQWEGLEKDGQFRYTPPTHALLAFHRALKELEAEGGVAVRAARYRANYQTCLRGMEDLGFVPYLGAENRGYIITSFLYPEHPNFDFQQFYELLNNRGFVIYPGKLSTANCFRIGHVGRIEPSDVNSLLAAVKAALIEMGVSLQTQEC